jgi:osmotically-inducible protein OsmY
MRVVTNLKCLIIMGLITCPVYTFAYTSDAEINNKVINKITADKSLDGVVISVKTAKGVVSLSGNVESDTQAAAATELAQSTSDV